METKKLKPFDLEAAKRGEPLVTRDGRKAFFIAHVPEVDRASRVVGRVAGDCTLYVFYETGRYLEYEERENDLFMATRTVTRWVNFYPIQTAHHFHAEATARGLARSDAIAIAVPVEIEI
jgi:hypothetical protein